MYLETARCKEITGLQQNSVCQQNSVSDRITYLQRNFRREEAMEELTGRREVPESGEMHEWEEITEPAKVQEWERILHFRRIRNFLPLVHFPTLREFLPVGVSHHFVILSHICNSLPLRNLFLNPQLIFPPKPVIPPRTVIYA